MAIDRSIGNYHDSSNARIRKIGKITGPTVYAVGGEALAPTAIGLGQLEAFLAGAATNLAHTTVYILCYDYVTQRVMWWNMATGAEAIAGADLSGYSARFEAIGH